jgi:D-alanyl-D-alanine carboxypeptidase
MNSQDRFLMGSVGKTLYAAAALKLATEGKLDLDAPIASYLPANAVPDSDNVTSRMLLGHRSGYPTYDEEFIVDLIRDPLRIRTLADWTGPIRRSPKSAAPDTEFVYSDVNYVVLAAVIEGATGHPAYAVIRRLLLQPVGLGDIVPADTVRIERLVPGYEGPDGLFKTDKTMGPQGLVFNPQFESGGGGFASTPADLARWIVALRLGTAIPAESWRLMSTPTSTTEDGQYGLGIHVDQSAIGRAYGHSGYIPGYLAWLRWYEDAGFAVAVQTNTSDNARFKEGGYAFLDRLARSVAQSCALLSP